MQSSSDINIEPTHGPCYKCKKDTDMFCANCRKSICSKHYFYIRQRFFCADCFLEERRKGMIRIWIFPIIIGLIATILFVLWK